MGTFPHVVLSCVRLCRAAFIVLCCVKLREFHGIALCCVSRVGWAWKILWRPTKTTAVKGNKDSGLQVICCHHCTVFVGLLCPFLSLGLLGSRGSRPPGEQICFLKLMLVVYFEFVKIQEEWKIHDNLEDKMKCSFFLELGLLWKCQTCAISCGMGAQKVGGGMQSRK